MSSRSWNDLDPSQEVSTSSLQFHSPQQSTVSLTDIEKQEKQSSPNRSIYLDIQKSRSGGSGTRFSSNSSYGEGSRRKFGLLKANESNLPVNAVKYFSWYRAGSIVNFIFVLIVLVLDIILWSAPTGFARRGLVTEGSWTKFLAFVYFFEVSFPFFVGVYSIFAGAFDYIHLRTFSRIAICEVFFTNALKLIGLFSGYIGIHTGAMKNAMFLGIETYEYEVAVSDSHWDHVHPYFRCCGVVNYTDWERMPNFDGVLPASCCGNPNGLRNKRCKADRLKKERMGCFDPLQTILTDYLLASIILNIIQLSVLCITIWCAYMSWKILCQDDEFQGDELWKLAKVKYKKQSRMSFFFLCVPDAFWKIIQFGLGRTFEESQSQSERPHITKNRISKSSRLAGQFIGSHVTQISSASNPDLLELDRV